jgi:hypothetical protein
MTRHINSFGPAVNPFSSAFALFYPGIAPNESAVQSISWRGATKHGTHVSICAPWPNNRLRINCAVHAHCTGAQHKSLEFTPADLHATASEFGARSMTIAREAQTRTQERDSRPRSPHRYWTRRRRPAGPRRPCPCAAVTWRPREQRRAPPHRVAPCHAVRPGESRADDQVRRE